LHVFAREKYFSHIKNSLFFSESGSIAVLLQIPYFVNAAAREGTFIYLIKTAVSRAVWLPPTGSFWILTQRREWS
jgi:hypothetical protein